MLNRSASLAMSTCVLKALPGNFDIKRHSLSILYLHDQLANSSMPYFRYGDIVLLDEKKCFQQYDRFAGHAGERLHPHSVGL